MHYHEVRSKPLKYAREFIFDPFLRIFPCDSLGAVPENPGTVLRSARISVGTIRRGTTVPQSAEVLPKIGSKLGKSRARILAPYIFLFCLPSGRVSTQGTVSVPVIKFNLWCISSLRNVMNL